MKYGRWKLAVAIVLATALVESTVYAQDRVSGVITRTFVIVEDTELVGDVSCEVGSSPCFSFGASNVELRLNGFTMTGRAEAVTGCGGASFPTEIGVTTNNQNNVSVRGPGLVQRFRSHGVLVVGSTNVRVEAITASTNCMSGVLVAGTSFGTIVQGNVSVRNGSSVPGASCGGI